MEQRVQIYGLGHRLPFRGRSGRQLHHRLYGISWGLMFDIQRTFTTRIPPERIGKDADRATRGADVFHLAAVDPVVDRAPADSHMRTGLKNRERLTIDHGRSSTHRWVHSWPDYRFMLVEA